MKSKNLTINGWHINQKYWDCQLITSINAYRYLTGKRIDQNTEEYERLVDLTKCRYGGALEIEKADEYFNLKTFYVPATLAEIKFYLDIGHPLGMSLFSQCGYHEVLIVGYTNKKIQVLNLPETDKCGNITWKKLSKMKRKNCPLKVFAIKNDENRTCIIEESNRIK